MKSQENEVTVIENRIKDHTARLQQMKVEDAGYSDLVTHIHEDEALLQNLRTQNKK